MLDLVYQVRYDYHKLINQPNQMSSYTQYSDSISRMASKAHEKSAKKQKELIALKQEKRKTIQSKLDELNNEMDVLGVISGPEYNAIVAKQNDLLASVRNNN